MRIGPSTPPSISMDDVPVEAQIDAELMAKDLGEQRLEGQEAVKMIEAAAAGVNRPLTSGPIGRRINIAV